MNRFLVIDATAAGETGRAIPEWIPASVRSIAGILESEKIDYDVMLVEDFLRNENENKKIEYDVFLITGMSSDAPMIKRAAELIQAAKKPFVIGGPITFDPYVLSELNTIAIIGEGEKTFQRLLKLGIADGNIDEEQLSSIDGVAYRKHGKIKVNPPRGYLSKEELNSFFPSVQVIKYYPFYQHIGVVVEILRGCSNFHRAKGYHGKRCTEGCRNCESEVLSQRVHCPQNIPAGCGFCCVGGLYGYPRSREQKFILREIKELIENGAGKISFLVPDPLDYKREELVAPEPLTDPSLPEPNYEELEKFCKMLWDIPEVADEEVIITIRDVKATLVTERSARIIKEYFPYSILGLGCESGSARHCINLGRGYTPREVEKAVEILNRHGIKPKVNLIFGLPGQSAATINETLDFIERLKNKVLYFDAARFEALPATAFEDCESDFGPVRDENSRRLLARVNEIQKRLFEQMKGEEWEVAVGVYKSNGERSLESKGPKRRFRQLAGVVGYPIFMKRHLSLIATVVRLNNPSPELKTGDIKTVKIKGASEIGFRVVLEGDIIK